MKSKLKILFINPISINRDALPIPPLGILYLAAYVREKGYQNIKVVDNNFYDYSLKVLEQEIKKHDIIAVSGTTSQYKQAVDIAKIAKKNNKISIMGGPHATALPQETAKHFNYVVIGEGEIALHEILQGKHKKGVVQGIFANLDELPFPARDLIPLLKYGTRELKRFKGQYTHMMTGRGCISKCTFCSSPLMWKCYRMISVKRVFEEMMFVYKKYGIKNIHFQDDTFTISKKRIMDLCNLIIQSKIPFKWSCQTRPDQIDMELLKKMKKAGCVQIEYGVESGDPKILKTSKKGYTKEQIKKAFELAKQAGIITYGFFIIGLPGETIFTWIKSMIFAKQLKLDSCVWTVLVPFPGTEIFNKKLVTILNPDYTYWLYKQPVIKSGYLGPTSLKIMRWIADKYVNGFRNTGTYKKSDGKRLRKINKKVEIIN